MSREDRHSRKHIWLTAERGAARRIALQDSSVRPELLPAISAHRRVGGPYTAAGTLLRWLVPQAVKDHPELAAAHEIEILTVAADLMSVLPATKQTLTTLAIPEERTRFYSAARTLRIANGLVELLRDFLILTERPPGSLYIDQLHEADYTDQEFVSVLLRRIDPAMLTVIIGSPAELARRGAERTDRLHASGLPTALAGYCTVKVADRPGPVRLSGSAAELARRYVESDCTRDEVEFRDAYQQSPAADRRALHDARADALEFRGQHHLRLGAIPLHRQLGSDPQGSGFRVLLEAMTHCMEMGFYDAALERCEQGQRLCPVEDGFDRWWSFTNKLPTILGALGLTDRIAELCLQVQAMTDNPAIQSQLAYACAMLHTRHLEVERQDHLRALGWIRIAIALTSQFEDPVRRAIGTVFNQNGQALIEGHLHRPEVALELVSQGIKRLDAELPSDEHRLHRSVLRYNRAQVLVGMKRYPEALADYRHVIEVDPHYPEYHFELGNLLHRMGRDQEALEAYEQAARLGPPFPEAHYNRADVLVDLGRPAEALAGFSYVLELEPDNVDALLNHGGLLADLEGGAAALPDVVRGLELDPTNAQLLSLRGRIAVELGDLAAARQLLDTALAADPLLVSGWIWRGSLNFEEGRLADAVADLSTAVHLDESDLVARFNRGCALQALGRSGEALGDFDRVLSVDPLDADALARREQCLFAVTAGTGPRPAPEPQPMDPAD